MSKSDFKFVKKDQKLDIETTRRSLTYWQDAWRRLKKNKLSMVGLVLIAFIILFGVVGPVFTQHTYSDQYLYAKNVEPKIEVYTLEDDLKVFFSGDLNLLRVTDKNELVVDGELYGRFVNTNKDPINKVYTYELEIEDEAGNVIDTIEVKVDFIDGLDNKVLIYNGQNFTESESVTNRSFLWGSDKLGRDVLTRVMYGAQISLTIALVATLVNFFIGVTYGAIAGYEGGRVDNIMMRIIDIINSIPLVLYVIIIMVLFESTGLGLIVLVIGSVYWVGMGRLVRGQILGLKGQEFILAARTIGVPRTKIIFKHLIPNAMGPIIVALTMMIPTAVFTEAFLSFIGLGISPPLASWGTLANDALGQLLDYPYQLFYPSLAIAITMLAFNFLGDGLRDALDPRLRKG